MRRLIPSTGTPASFFDLVRAYLPVGGERRFEEAFCRWAGSPWCRFVNSGTTALYLILKALRTLRPDRDEVLLPAYTAPSLVLPIRRAGLRPVLCDVDLETLNADLTDAGGRLTPRTLAFLMIPMYGLPCDAAEARRMAERYGAFLVEDAASAMGSRMDGRMAGTRGDVGFLSFNRGKNLSTVSGGVVLTDREEIQQAVAAQCATLPAASLRAEVRLGVRAFALALAVRPFWYTLLHGTISRFKYTSLHTDFEMSRYTDFQARLGFSLLRCAETFLTQRHKNGILLYNILSNTEGVALPRILPGAHVVFNQFPVLLSDPETRDAAHRAVLKAGVEATTLYPEPIHRLYGDLGYGRDPDPFPGATAVSRRLLLLPTHPLIEASRLREAGEAVIRAVKR
ncbi:MAG: hypothetical protein EXS64_05595 [Candidatus Latescibacteria bacterium]|nr:hypothetical protein [Candidatus Latescibacterota bacterium]